MAAKVLPFHPAVSRSLNPKIDVSSFNLREAAQPENTRKYWDGMTPAARQLLTAGAPTPSFSATAPVPPKASMMASTVLSMTDDNSVYLKMSSLQPCRIDFRKYECLSRWMETVGTRLRDWLAAEDMSQADLVRKYSGHPKFNITPSKVSQWCDDTYKLDQDFAIELCDRYGLSLDWLYRDRISDVADGLKKKIMKVQAERLRSQA